MSEAYTQHQLRLERHASMQSSDEVIAAAVERATGTPLATRMRVTTGFSNEVYDVTTDDSQRVIVRIHHPVREQ